MSSRSRRQIIDKFQYVNAKIRQQYGSGETQQKHLTQIEDRGGFPKMTILRPDRTQDILREMEGGKERRSKGGRKEHTGNV